MAKRDFIAVEDLSREQVELLLDTAESFLSVLERDIKKVPTLRGRTVVNVFWEESSRTAPSFELAAKRLSADTVTLGPGRVATEAPEDVAVTVEGYGPDVVVLRHPSGDACTAFARATEASVVSAGCGTGQHPTQCLADLFALRQTFGRDLAGLTVAIVGDVLHSRVARSTVAGLRLLDAEVTLVGPAPLIPGDLAQSGAAIAHDVERLREADVVYVLPAAGDRLEGPGAAPEPDEIAQSFRVTAARLRPGQRVMHPGPVARGAEISADVLDGAGSLVALQAFGGVAVRMAVLYRAVVGYADAGGEGVA